MAESQGFEPKGNFHTMLLLICIPESSSRVFHDGDGQEPAAGCQGNVQLDSKI